MNLERTAILLAVTLAPGVAYMSAHNLLASPPAWAAIACWSLVIAAITTSDSKTLTPRQKDLLKWVTILLTLLSLVFLNMIDAHYLL